MQKYTTFIVSAIAIFFLRSGLASQMLIKASSSQASSSNQAQVSAVSSGRVLVDRELWNAVIKNDIERVRSLSKDNDEAYVNASTSSRKTALMEASERGLCDMVRLLLLLGAEPQQKDFFGRSAVSFASSREVVAILDEFTQLEGALKGGSIERVYDFCFTHHKDRATNFPLLHFAWLNGYRALVKMVLENIDRVHPIQGVNVEDKGGGTVLHIGSVFQEDDLSMLKMLCAYNVDLQKKNKSGRTPIMLAARQYGLCRFISCLLEKEPDSLDMQDNDGNTALIHAAMEGNDKEVELLIKKHASLNIQNEEGDTALHFACMGDHIRVVELLLQARAFVKIRNNEGLSVLDIVASVHPSEFDKKQWGELFKKYGHSVPVIESEMNSDMKDDE